MAPDTASPDGPAVPSMVVRPGGAFSPEMLRKMPDDLILAMAAALNDAAAEMEVRGCD